MNVDRRDFFEAFVEIIDESKLPEAKNYLTSAGLNTIETKTGLYTSGTARQFESLLGLEPNTIEANSNTPVPNNIRHAIKSINIIPVPDFY